MRLLIHVLVPLIILSLGVGSFVVMKDLKEYGITLGKDSKNSSTGKKRGARGGNKQHSQAKIRTRVSPLKKTQHTVQLTSQGVIRTHNATSLTPQVGGRVSFISPHFEDGAFFNEGDVLLKLETADYETDLESAKAQLARAEAAFAQEEARAKQALLNWKDAGFKEDASDLVLRKPQLREAEANVRSTASSLKRAERNLARTQVKAPYDGRVRKRHIGLGQQVGASTALGDIFSTDFAEVRLPLTSRDLTYFTPPNKPNTPLKKTRPIRFTSIHARHNDDETKANDKSENSKKFPDWPGVILRAEGELDTESRQLFIIARIDDPFGIRSEKPSLFIGQPVKATIDAETLNDVYVIPRKNLSGLNEILIVREGKLKRTSIIPIWSSPDFLLTRGPFQPGDLLTTTRLPYAPEGAPIDIIPEPGEPADAGEKIKPANPINHSTKQG